MPINFNNSPYFDDFDAEKNYQRILFKPGVAVQARELTQSQTIIQNQIGSFGANIFKDGSIVSGGQTALDDSAFYLIVSATYNIGNQITNVDYSSIVGQYIKEESTGKIGLVKAYIQSNSSDQLTLFVSIVGGKQTAFGDNSTFTVTSSESSLQIVNRFSGVASTTTLKSSGSCLLFHINKGIFFTNHMFVHCAEQTIVIGKYTKLPSVVVGLNIIETTSTYVNDTSLLDPALGASNYLAPGADRYKVDLQLSTQAYASPAVSYQNFIQLATVVGGSLTNQVNTPIYSTIMDTMAKRTYDTNGDFVVKQFLPTIKIDAQNTANLMLSISAGSAFVKGYEIETISPTNLSIAKSQSTETKTSELVSTTLGNIVNINSLTGSLPKFGQTANAFVVEIHNVTSQHNTTSLMGTAVILNVEYSIGTGTNAVFGACLTDITLTSTNFGAARSFVIPSTPNNYSAFTFSAIIDGSSIKSNYATLQYPSLSSLLFKLPYEFTKSLDNVEYYFKKFFSGTVFADTVTISISTTGDSFIPSIGESILQNYTMVTTTGQLIPLDAATITLSTPQTAVINLNTNAYAGASVHIITTIHTSDDNSGVGRVKTLTKNEVGAQLTVTGTEKNSLMKSDVYLLDAVYEFPTTSTYKGVWLGTTAYAVGDVVYTNSSAYISTINNTNQNPATSSSWTIIKNSSGFYSINTGQKDSYYDHGSIYRNSKPLVSVKIIPVFSYFTHSGIGHISPNSYPTTGTNRIDYANIPTYRSSLGDVYKLNSCIDFRPIRVNGSTSLQFESFQIPASLKGIPVTADITYYLGRIDKAILTRDGLFKILPGIPAQLNPKPPASQEDSITLFILTCSPYTSTPEDVKLRIVSHKRYTMKDISTIDDRLSNIEYYTTLNTLETQTDAQVVTNVNGTNLFKNGFIVDTFSGSGIADILNPEYRSSIDYTNGIARPAYIADNVYLRYDKLTSTTNINSDTTASLITVPYTKNVFVNQPAASEAISVNPFGVVNFVGTLKLTPESDVWFDTNTSPLVIVNSNGGNDNYQNNSGIETQWNAWQDIWTGTQISEESSGSVGRPDGSLINSQQYSSTTTTRTTSSGPGVKTGSSTTIVDNGVMPYARQKKIEFKVDGMATNTKLYLYINGQNMSTYLYPYSQTVGATTVNPGITTDSTGSASGYLFIPNNKDIKFETGNEDIVICDNAFDWTKSVSYAQATFFSEGFIKTLNKKTISTKPNNRVTTQLKVNTTSNYATDIIQSSPVSIDSIVVPSATYALTSNHSTIVEGESATFVFTTTNTPPGTEYKATISGTVVNADLSGGNRALGETTIKTVGTSVINSATISIPISSGAISGTTNKVIKLEVEAKSKNGEILKFYSEVEIQNATVADYFITAPSYVIAGQSANMVFEATGLLTPTVITYTITGSTGYSGTTGTFTLNTPSDTETLVFDIPSGYTQLGNGGDFILVSYSWGLAHTKKSRINVAATVDYALSNFSETLQASTSTVQAGQTFTINLLTFGLVSGTTVPYTITGVSSANISGASLTGNFTVDVNGKASLSVVTSSAIITLKPFQLTLNGHNRSIDVGISPVPVVSPIIISGPKEIQVNEIFDWIISNGPPNGTFWCTNNHGGVGGSKTTGFPLDSTGSYKQMGQYTASQVGMYIWTFYFSDDRQVSVSQLVKAATVAPIFTVNGPATASTGQVVTFNISSTNQPTPITATYTISNPSGLWLSAAAGTTVTFNNSGAIDYEAYVDTNGDILIAYLDAVSANAGHIITMYAQNFKGVVFKSPQEEYDYMLNAGSDWRVWAAKGKSYFGQKVFENGNGVVDTTHTKPMTSTISGSFTISDATPQNISFLVNNEDVATSTSTLKLVISGAISQEKAITINNTYNVVLPVLAPASQKIVGSGDFIDSRKTYLEAIEEFVLVTDGMTSDQIWGNPANAGKLWLTAPWKADMIADIGPWVLAAYRNPAFMNRNPELNAWLKWCGQIYSLQNPSYSGVNVVYKVPGHGAFGNQYGVWVTDKGDNGPFTPQTIVRQFIAAAGTYTVTFAADDVGELYITSVGTGTQKILTADFVNPKSTTVSLPAGLTFVTIVAQNVGVAGNTYSTNPAWYAATITNSSGVVVWDTVTSASTQVNPINGLTKEQAKAEATKAFVAELATTGETLGSRAQFLACKTDPLAQTFFVSENIYPNGVFLTGADIFFEGKDDKLPVFVQLRPTNNGYPSSDTVLPLSTVWMNPVDVKTSIDGSAATYFKFSDPVYLAAGQYAVVVGSNSGKYKAFTGTLGSKVLGTKNTIASQPNVGSLFESQNASTWTAEQSSDLCFVLYQAIFDTTTAFMATFKSEAPIKSFKYELAEVVTQELDFSNSTTVKYFMKSTDINGFAETIGAEIVANQNTVLSNTKKNTLDGDTIVQVLLSTTDKNISPVLDTDRMSLIMVNNIVNNTTDVTIPETNPTGGNAAAKYVTRPVILSDGFQSTGMTVNMSLNCQAGAYVEVYVKVKAADDKNKLESLPWQLVPNTSDLFTYSKSYSDFSMQKYQLENISYVSSGVTYHNFQTFIVKVVMYSSKTAIVPQIANFGAIATA